MERIWLRWWGCGAFDVRFGDVNIAFDPYLFGENLDNAQPIYDYIFISHEHFDHCHPKTLRKLCQGERFKRLFVPPGLCGRMSQLMRSMATPRFHATCRLQSTCRRRRYR